MRSCSEFAIYCSENRAVTLRLGAAQSLLAVVDKLLCKSNSVRVTWQKKVSLLAVTSY